LERRECIFIVDTVAVDCEEEPMIARVALWGNSLALRIPSFFAKELDVVDGRSVELTVQGSSLVVTPVKEIPRYDLAELVSAITEENRHGEVTGHYAVGEEFS
jgi:antitoxin MazE